MLKAKTILGHFFEALVFLIAVGTLLAGVLGGIYYLTTAATTAAACTCGQ